MIRTYELGGVVMPKLSNFDHFCAELKSNCTVPIRIKSFFMYMIKSLIG